MGVLTAYEAIRSNLAGKKTPYQLDLEVKDRKPDIVPKVGDKVKIKSRGWYEKWKDSFGVVYVPWGFVDSMKDACGNIFEVERVESTIFHLKGSRYNWSLGMFEEVYPVLEINPYLLDLEVKDRKPDIVPKVGDKVKIKSREWYEKWKDKNGYVLFDTTDCTFAEDMKVLCGKTFIVRKIDNRGDKRWKLGMDNHYWVPEFFEEVYPAEEQITSECPGIDITGHSLYQLPYNVNRYELVLSKEEQERLKEQIRIKWSVKSKLKQIKTTHLIKLKKL